MHKVFIGIKNKFRKLYIICGSRRITRLGVALVYLFVVCAASLYAPQQVEAAISLRDSAIANSGSATVTSQNVVIPATTIAGDIIVVMAVTDEDTVTHAFSNGTWIAIGSCTNTNGDSDMKMTASYRKAVAADAGTTISVTWDGSSRRAISSIGVFKGVDQVTPVDAAAGACQSATSSGTALTTNAITTTANSRIVAFWGVQHTSASAGSISSTNTTVAQTGGTSTNCTLICTNNNIISGLSHANAAGGSETKAATGSITGNWNAFMFSLKAAAFPTLDQASYRFMHNLDATETSYIATDPDTGRDDFLKGIAIDTANGYIYMGGNNSQNWLTQKRRLDDGSLVTSYGTSGQTTTPITGSGTEAIASLVLDVDDNAFYVAGYRASGGDNIWRIEKRSAATGNLCSSTSNCPVVFDGDGIIEVGFNSEDAEVYAMALDTVNHHLYIGGFSRNTTSNTDEWRVGKYNTSNGSVVTAYGTSGYTTFDATAEDRVKALAVDPSGGYLYVGGYDTTGGDQEWRIEKRKIADGALCTAAACGTQFGTNGVYTSDPDATGNDQLLAFQIDTPGNAIYAAGYDFLDATNNNQWRIEKLTVDTGSLVSGFGSGGAVNYDSGTSAGNDQIIDIDLDDYGGYIYTAGQVQNTVTGSNPAADLEWRIEKRKRSDGTLESTFGTSGVARSDPSTNNDSPAWILVDLPRNLLYTAGGDRTPGASLQRWRIEKYDLFHGSIWMGPASGVGVASTNITLRLRLLLHVTSQQMLVGDQTLKLKYSLKSGTCDTAGVGEIYNDVTTTTEVKFHDNPSHADAAQSVALDGDPTHGGGPDTRNYQGIEELNNFAILGDISPGNDGVYDFVLQDNNSFGAYCFKAVYSNNDDLTVSGGTYSIMPEMTFCRNDPRTESLLRHGTYFCEGVKKNFYWSVD